MPIIDSFIDTETKQQYMTRDRIRRELQIGATKFRKIFKIFAGKLEPKLHPQHPNGRFYCFKDVEKAVFEFDKQTVYYRSYNGFRKCLVLIEATKKVKIAGLDCKFIVPLTEYELDGKTKDRRDLIEAKIRQCATLFGLYEEQQ